MGLELNLFSKGFIEIRLPILSDRTALIIKLIDAIFLDGPRKINPYTTICSIRRGSIYGCGKLCTETEMTAVLQRKSCISKLGNL